MRWVMNEPGYGRAPFVSVGNDGVAWVSWISWTQKGECIRFCARAPGGDWSEPIACTEPRPFVTGLSTTPFEDGLLVAWIDGDDGDNDGLKIKKIGPDGRGEPVLIAPWRRGPAHPAVAAEGSIVALAWTFRSVGGRQAAACFGGGPANLLEPVEISAGGGHNLRPAVSCARGRAVVVWEAISKGPSRILARVFRGGLVESDVVQLAAGDGGICARPAAQAALGGGTWVAWQSDVDPKTGPGLVRWIEVAHLGEDMRVRRPAAAMAWVNRRDRGVDQGFETPSLAVLK